MLVKHFKMAQKWLEMQKCQLGLESWRETEFPHEPGLLSTKVRAGDRIFQPGEQVTALPWDSCSGLCGALGNCPAKNSPSFYPAVFFQVRTASLRQRLQSAAGIESYFWFRLWLFPGESLIDFLTFLWLIFPRLLKIVCTSAAEAFWVLEIRLKLRRDCCHYNIQFQIISNLLKIPCIWWM